MGLFTPAWKSDNEKKALAYIEKCDSQKKLAQIVHEYPYRKGRRNAALLKLTDQDELRNIAVEWSGLYEYDVFEIVFERLTDQTHLASVARNAKEYRIRAKATERLKDQLVLAEIAQKDENAIVRQRAIDGLTDQTLLAGIAQTDDSAMVRKKAAEHLTDQSILEKIARKEKSVEVFRAALIRITDSTIRQSIALTGPDPELRANALDGLEDQDKLMDLAQKDNNAKVRAEAAKRLTNQNYLAILGLTHSDGGVRRIVAERIADEEILMEIARSDKMDYVRDAARKRITDKDKQVDLALEEDSFQTRKWAVEHLSPDDPRLVKIALEDKHYDVRYAAIDRMEDPKLLRQVAAVEGQDSERALKRLTEKEDLEWVAKQRGSSSVLNRMKELGFWKEKELLEILEGSEHPDQFLIEKLCFLIELSRKHLKGIRNAYEEKNIDKLENYPQEESIEAAILLFREYGSEHGPYGREPSILSYKIQNYLTGKKIDLKTNAVFINATK